MFQRGDFWCTINPHGFIGGGISCVQKYRTIGFLSKANHSGFFTNENTVFESLWRVEENNVWKYEGVEFLVGRWKGMTDARWETAYRRVRKYERKFYPVPRLFMFLLTPIMVQLVSPMRLLGLGFFSSMVCSELTGFMLHHAGFSVFDEFRGMMPARIAQIIRRDRDVEIIHDKAPLRRL